MIIFMKKEILESYKGVRDFYPKDQYILDYIKETMSNVCESFGFEHYGASILESADLYKNKTSEEIVNEQTYIFKDRGGREVVMRPEMTPTVTRMVAKKRRDLAYPLRLYSIPNVFRYERPQKGRLREHWQLNADIFNAEGMDYEFELVELASAIFLEFGATQKDFIIKINSRKVLDDIFDSLDIPSLARKSTLALLDKKTKISKEDFDEHLQQILANKKDIFLTLLRKTKEEGELKYYLDRFTELGIKNVEIDTSIVRGFDYYTGFIFEVFDTNTDNPRALCGGGRYDKLFSSLGQEDMPALGFGLGDVTVRDFLELRDLLPEYKPATEVMLINIPSGDHAKLLAHKVASEMRSGGVAVSLNYSARKMEKQIKSALKMKIPYCLPVGDNSDSFELIDTKTKKPVVTGSPKDLVEYIFSHEL